jgi:hypothetical protein
MAAVIPFLNGHSDHAHAHAARFCRLCVHGAHTQVYYEMMKQQQPPLIERLRRYYGCGPWAGKILCVLVAVDFLLYMFLEWLFPRSEIDIAPNFSLETYQRLCQLADKSGKDDERHGH